MEARLRARLSCPQGRHPMQCTCMCDFQIMVDMVYACGHAYMCRHQWHQCAVCYTSERVWYVGVGVWGVW